MNAVYVHRIILTIVTSARELSHHTQHRMIDGKLPEIADGTKDAFRSLADRYLHQDALCVSNGADIVNDFMKHEPKRAWNIASAIESHRISEKQFRALLLDAKPGCMPTEEDISFVKAFNMKDLRAFQKAVDIAAARLKAGIS